MPDPNSVPAVASDLGLPAHVVEVANRLELGEPGQPVPRRRSARAVAVGALAVGLVTAPLVAGWSGPGLLLGLAVLTLPGLFLLTGVTWGAAELRRNGVVTAYPFDEGLVIAHASSAVDMAAARWPDVSLAPPDPRHPSDVRLQLGEGRPRRIESGLFAVVAAKVTNQQSTGSAFEGS